jgi:hypothetical protein
MSQITKTLTKFTEVYEKLVSYLSLNKMEQHKVGAECVSDKKLEKCSSPVTGLEWPRGFQQVKVPRFLYNYTGWW